MSMEPQNDAARYAAQVLRPARIIRTICQMILGLGLAITLILKVYMLVLTDHQCVADAVSLGNGIRCADTLEIMSYTLALAAGFELAFLMFEDSDERAVRPLLFAVSAVLLFLLSGLSAGEANWQMALTLLALSLTLFGGLTFRHRLVGIFKARGGEE
ncbi:MAG: hypothetical protein OIF48_06945 [Silicimonas sp.]|nr:hypothetical protein [Silicimonas sp.]